MAADHCGARGPDGASTTIKQFVVSCFDPYPALLDDDEHTLFSQSPMYPTLYKVVVLIFKTPSDQQSYNKGI